MCFLDVDVAKEGPFTYLNFPITDIVACARSVEITAQEIHKCMLRFLLRDPSCLPVVFVLWEVLVSNESYSLFKYMSIISHS